MQARDEEDFGDEVGPAEDGEEDGATPSSGLPWEGSDRDYTYEELLGKLASIALPTLLSKPDCPQTALIFRKVQSNFIGICYSYMSWKAYISSGLLGCLLCSRLRASFHE